MGDKTQSFLKSQKSYVRSSGKKLQGLTLAIPTKIKQQYPSLTRWEKMFINSFYEGKSRPTGQRREEKVRADIEAEWQRLCALDKREFVIDSVDNPDLDREFESEVKALRARGEGQTADYSESHKNEVKAEMAKQSSQTLYEEYRHIVDFISSTSFELAFKVLMLRETLAKTYKKDKDGDNEKTIVKPREPHKTIASHMTLNQDVLNTIYNEVEAYSNFANLYFAGVAISNKTISQKSGVKISGLDTFGMGKWIKFEGKRSNPEKYIQNAQALAALVQETPWCTKTLAASQLEQGDFFVFVDNDNKPHIAVKMSGNTVDEVRGIQNGNRQELEDEYRKVAVEFLTKNPKVKDGEKWLAKEAWNARLVMYRQQIESGTFDEGSMPDLIATIFDTSADYKVHGAENSNLAALKALLPKISKLLAKHFNCTEEEVAFGDVDFEGMTSQPYVIILGNAYFFGSKFTSAENLRIICGYADFEGSQITSTDSLQSICGNAFFGDSQITSLDSLQSIGGYANFSGSQITDLGRLQSIGGSADFANSQITTLGHLQTIGGWADFNNSQITDLGALQSIDGDADFSGSQITDLGSLQSIGGYADFRNSQVTDLGQLQSIGGIIFTDETCLIDVETQFKEYNGKWIRKEQESEG